MGTRARITATLTGLFVTPVLAAGAAQAAAAAPEPGTLRGGEVAQTGWWNAVNESPDNPLTPPPPPPAPDVPGGTLPVTVVTGEPRRISAIEFALDGEPGSSVDTVELALVESGQRNVTANADGALIQACTVTEAFWVGGENNPWKNRPAFDCDAGSAKGVRDAKTGVWSFDLTALASEWKAEDFFGSPSVVLVGEAAGENGEPLNFQVVFDGLKAKGIGLAAKTTAPTSGAVTGSGSGSVSGGAGSSGSVGDVGGGGADLGGGESVGDLGSGDVGAVDAGLPAPDAAEAAPEAAAGGEQLALVSAVPLPWYDDLLKPSALLLPLVLMLAYLAMLAMGPAAQPVGVTNRRGVSRALDKLRSAGAGIASKTGR
jgi:hypothetical protein